jgi:hypothetical protein
MTSFDTEIVRLPDIVRREILYHHTQYDNDIDNDIINASMQSYIEEERFRKKREIDIQRFIEQEERIKREYEKREIEKAKSLELLREKTMNERVQTITNFKVTMCRIYFGNLNNNETIRQKIFTSLDDFCMLKTTKIILTCDVYDEIISFITSKNHRLTSDYVTKIKSLLQKEMDFAKLNDNDDDKSSNFDNDEYQYFEDEDDEYIYSSEYEEEN